MRQHSAEFDAVSGALEAAEGMGRGQRPVRILHVEDDDIDARIIAHFLQAVATPSLLVDRASGVEEALARLERRDDYDLCLLDCWLDMRSSLQIVARIDAAPRRIPIVLVSGAVGPEAREFALMAGAADCVGKNELTAERLAAAIETALAQRGPKPSA